MSIAAWLVVAAMIFGGGFIGGAKFVHAQWNAAKLAQSEANRETERLANRGSAKVSDGYNAKTAAATATAVATRDELHRLRNAIAQRPEPAEPACSAHAERIATLERLFAEGAALVEEGGRRVGSLAAQADGLQGYVSDVCRVHVSKEKAP